MKYVIIRCEDLAPPSESLTSLFEGAKLLQLQQMAQAGSAGLIQPPANHLGLNRFELHRELLGVANESEVSAAICYAAAAGVEIEDGCTAWCCELVTQQDDCIVDDRAGQITIKESQVLLHDLEARFGSELRRWETGQGSHHLFIVTDPSLRSTEQSLLPPDLLINQPWRKHLPKGELGNALRQVIEEVAGFLENHPINKVRVDLGENPANMMWCWGATPVHSSSRSVKEENGAPRAEPVAPLRTPVERNPERVPRLGFASLETSPELAEGRAHGHGPWYESKDRLSRIVLSSDFALRGLAKVIGIDCKASLSSFEEAEFHALMQNLSQTIPQHDLVYVHLSIDRRDPVERLCVMERVDQGLLKPLLNLLPAFESWRMCVVMEEYLRRRSAVIGLGSAWSGIPVAHLNAQELAKSTLQFNDGAAVFSWLKPSSI